MRCVLIKVLHCYFFYYLTLNFLLYKRAMVAILKINHMFFYFTWTCINFFVKNVIALPETAFFTIQLNSAYRINVNMMIAWRYDVLFYLFYNKYFDYCNWKFFNLAVGLVLMALWNIRFPNLSLSLSTLFFIFFS